MSKTLTQQWKEAKDELAVYRHANVDLESKFRVADEMLAEYGNMQLKVAELEKKLTASERLVTANNNCLAQFSNELEALHEVLDALPGSIPKRPEGSYRDRSVLTRLAAWLGSTK